MGKYWEKGEVPPVSLLLPAGPHSSPNPVTSMVSLQSQIFVGVLPWAIEAALTVFSGLPLGAGCSLALDTLISVYCRVPETKV